MRDIKIIVACRNKCGAPDLFQCSVRASETEYRGRGHYELAEARAREEGYEGPYLCFDENEFEVLHRVSEELRTDDRTTTLLETSIRDFRIAYNDETVPESQKQLYRMQASFNRETGQLYFNVYPEILDLVDNKGLQDKYGLFGVVDISHGQPAVSLGINNVDYDVFVNSDITAGLYVHATPGIKKSDRLFVPDPSQNKYFEAHYYAICESDDWIVNTRSRYCDLMAKELVLDAYPGVNADTLEMIENSDQGGMVKRTYQYVDQDNQTCSFTFQIQFDENSIFPDAFGTS